MYEDDEEDYGEYYEFNYEDGTYEDFNYENFNYEDLNYEELLNNTNAYIFYDDANVTSPELLQLERYIVPVVFTIIFIVGIIGNIIVIFVVIKRANMRTVTNLYLANLAGADLMFLLVCVPLTSAGFATTYWPFGLFLCRLENYIQSVNLAVSVLTLTATSVDRFYAIVHPVRSRVSRTVYKAKSVISVIWCMSVVIMIPRVFIFHQEEIFNIYTTRMYCSRSSDDLKLRRIDTLFMFVAMFLLPQIFLGVFHIRIIKQLWTSVRPGFRPNDITLTGLKTRRKIAKIVVAITCAFAIGWLPIHIVRLHEDFTGNGDTLIFRNREIFALCFSFGANSVNPIIYMLISSKFRNHFKSVLRCRRIQDGSQVVHAPPEGMRNVLEEAEPLRLESISPANEIALPQAREQVLITPSTSYNKPKQRNIQTLNLAQTFQSSDITSVV